MKNKIVVIFSSHLSDDEDSKFIKHITNTIGVKHKVFCYKNFNEYSLPELYNRALKEHYETNSIFVFCHNDIILKTMYWGKLLLNHFNHSDYAILGVAGTTFLPASGMWWEDRSKMYGIVEHTDGIKDWISEYSLPINGIQPTVVVDGVFMAVDPDGIECDFNEDYSKFHFYDIPFCFDNYLGNVNVGVISNIRVLHKSVGQTNQDWENSRKKFSEDYKDVLPIKHISDGKLKVLICCQFFKEYTGSEMSNYELSKELVKLGCDVTVISSLVGNPLMDKAKKNGVKVHSLSNIPNYVNDQEGRFHFVKTEAEFDIIHINHKPIGEMILQLYPNTPAVMHVRSEVIPVFEEPIVHSAIKKYISIRESVTEYIKTFGITDDQIIEIDNPFDTTRFNTNYIPIKNEKETILFVGSIDHLRRGVVLDLILSTQDNNQELWVIGEDRTQMFVGRNYPHVKYLGIKSNVEDYIKKCDFTAGIYRGRTTIEGYLCGKPGWIYVVDKEGNISDKKFTQVPNDLYKYDGKYSATQVLNTYNKVLENDKQE